MRLGRFAVLGALTFALAVISSGCGPTLSLPTVADSSLGGSLRLHDPAVHVDLSVRVTAIKFIEPAQAEPGTKWLGVHLVLKDVSPTPYNDPMFDSCSYLERSAYEEKRINSTTVAVQEDAWGPVQGGSLPAHTLTGSVTIMPNKTVDGWVWFVVQGKQPVAGAVDFSVAHVFSFRPAGGSASVIGTWQLEP